MPLLPEHLVLGFLVAVCFVIVTGRQVAVDVYFPRVPQSVCRTRTAPTAATVMPTLLWAGSVVLLSEDLFRTIVWSMVCFPGTA